MSVRTQMTVAVLAALCGAGTAQAQTSITLFGKQYQVQRFDYSAEVRLPNVAFPSDPDFGAFESEGLVWLGNNRLLMSMDDVGDVAILNPENQVIEVALDVSGNQITGLSYVRTVLTRPATPYDPNPGGITINTSPLGPGLASGGNLVLCQGDGLLFGYSLQPATLGQDIEFPVGSGCNGLSGECNLNMSITNTNAEDVVFVPALAGGIDQFYVINQDTSAVERWTTTGTRLGSFPVGGGAVPAAVGTVPKGICYIPDSSKLPASIRHPDGVILVSFDKDFPVLQAFARDGTLLGNEFLTSDGTAFGAPRLDVTGCTDGLNLESLAGDPATGRLFLSNQGTLELCNYFWILTPACPADFNSAGGVTVQDIFDFLSDWSSQIGGGPVVIGSADFNGDGSVTVQDIFDFLTAWSAGC